MKHNYTDHCVIDKRHCVAEDLPTDQFANAEINQKSLTDGSCPLPRRYKCYFI